MSDDDTRSTYFELEIIGETPSTEIWLGDDGGSLVMKATGRLLEHLLPGEYVVEFGLGTACYRASLFEDCSYTQAELQRSGPCERPVFRLPEGGPTRRLTPSAEAEVRQSNPPSGEEDGEASAR